MLSHRITKKPQQAERTTISASASVMQTAHTYRPLNAARVWERRDQGQINDSNAT